METKQNSDILKQFFSQLSDYPKNIALYDRLDRIAGLIYGCALGDCLGVQVEGYHPDSIRQYYPNGVTGLLGEDKLNKLAHKIELLDWSDDTDQMILLMDCLIESKESTMPGSNITIDFHFDHRLFAEKLRNWMKTGFAELGDLCRMSIGLLTARVLSHPQFLLSPTIASKIVHQSNLDHLGGSAPNGAVMRCGIIAISSNWKRYAIEQAACTHSDQRSIYSSWLVVMQCRALLSGVVLDNNTLLKNKDIFIKTDIHRKEFDKYCAFYCSSDLGHMLAGLELGDCEKMGYTLKTLGCSFYAIENIRSGLVKTDLDYKRIQLAIVNQGGDADTNAAVSGMVLGAYLGYRKLPSDWLVRLKHKNWLDKKIIRLFQIIINLR